MRWQGVVCNNRLTSVGNRHIEKSGVQVYPEMLQSF